MNRAFFFDLAERVGATYIQALLGLMAASSYNMFSISDARAAAVAALPAALSLIKSTLAGAYDMRSLASFAPGPLLQRKFATDLLERTGSTYLQTFLGLLLADTTHLLDMGFLRAAAVAALPAAAAVIKGAFAATARQDKSAAALPTRVLDTMRTATDTQGA